MQKEFLELLKQIHNIGDVAQLWSQGKSVNISGLAGAAKTGFLCALKELTIKDGPVVILTPRRDEIREYRRELNYFYPEANMLELYPTNLVTTQVDAKNQEILAERVAALELLGKEKPGVVFVTAEAFLQKLPATTSILQNDLTVYVGQVVEQEEIIQSLVERNYERTEQVETLGQFCIRGDIMDIFPINGKYPLRIEWFDNTIDGLRLFDPMTQRAIESSADFHIAPIVWDVQEDASATLFEYIKKNTLTIVDEPAVFFSTVENLSKEFTEHKEKIFSPKEIVQMCEDHKTVAFSALPHKYFPKANQVAAPVRSIAPYNKNTDLLMKDLAGWQKEGIVPLIMLNSKEKAAGLAESLRREGLNFTFVDKGELVTEGAGKIFSGDLSNGFRFWDEKWLLITEGDIFGMQKRKRVVHSKHTGPQIQFFSDIKAGDYVVHTIHGIGRYVGVKTIEVDGVHKDYLHIVYAKEDKLYVPVDQVSLLHKYIGNEGQAPKLSSMGGKDWKKINNRAQEAITILATELLRLYAQRKVLPGHAFSPDTPWQKEFEDSFPFEETPDQLEAIKDIKADMEKPVPMERLLCGDVGYGKTEVAIRAAFKAVMDGKQVALLAPTTVLAQQHLLTFKQRMSPFGVKVDLLSRFRTAKQQRETLKKLEEGQVDVLIGTHRILQPDVQFRDLGLLIVDEEQRFGVAQKEKMKKWTTGIDVLSLSATPIPRTLHMALVNGKDMSIIESPPEDRLPVETYVLEYNDSMIKEAIEREIKRGGQIYYVHNRIEGLSAIAKHLRELVPGISLKIAHGRMQEDMLEDAMVDFFEGKYDLLLCTTIIENGLDVTKANTIIVDGAENFGLSQLYQMRGRVGRSSRLAYAYFVYKRNKIISEVAQKRLQAIKDFTELGAGFKIAMRDLEIRGAGNLLGAQQHGHIAGIGFAAYCALLEKTIISLKNGKPGEPIEPDPVIEIAVDAYIPDDYIGDPRYKMEIYRRCSELNYEDRDDLLDEIIDRFGTPPVEVENLWRVASLRSLCKVLKIAGISCRQNIIRITFGKHTLCEPEKIIKFVEGNKGFMQIKQGPQPQLIIRATDFKEDILTWLENNIKKLV